MSEQPPYREWDQKEKEEEKEEEKHHEKEEKSWDEKWRRDPVSTAGWALAFIWAGFVLLLNNLDLLGAFAPFEVWDLILLGFAGIILLLVLFRLLVPTYRRPVTGSLIVAAIFVAIALGDLLPEGIFWSVVLIMIGLYIFLRAIMRGR